MADKQKKKNLVSAINMPIPECPVCFNAMCAPIRQCKTGHSLCNNCTNSLPTGLCPFCKEPMTGGTNIALEKLLNEMKVHCPNKPCVYTVKSGEMDDHLKECIFRIMDCPLGAANGKCSWNGMLKDILTHFEERHPTNRIKLNEKIELKNLKPNEDERLLFLANIGKYLFIVTFRIDTIQKLAYFVIQHIGSRCSAQNHFYEIEINSSDNRRQLVYKDHCFSDFIKVEQVFQSGQCAIVPLALLQHFIKKNTFSFRLLINRQGASQKLKVDDQPGRSKSPKRDFKDNRNFKPKDRDRSQSKGPKAPTEWITKSSYV